MHTPRRLHQFKKDYKKELRSGRGSDDVDELIQLLVEGRPLPAVYRDHPLKGDWKDFRECHVRPDLVIIYQIRQEITPDGKEESILELARLGDHAELFE